MWGCLGPKEAIGMQATLKWGGQSAMVWASNRPPLPSPPSNNKSYGQVPHAWTQDAASSWSAEFDLKTTQDARNFGRGVSAVPLTTACTIRPQSAFKTSHDPGHVCLPSSGGSVNDRIAHLAQEVLKTSTGLPPLKAPPGIIFYLGFYLDFKLVF